MFNNQKTAIMKRFIRTLFFCTTICAMSFTAMAQVTIGSVTPPAAFSLLELCTSNVKSGLRLPQLEKEEAATLRVKVADAIKAGEEVRVEGLMFYNLYTSCIEYWNGEMWRYLCGEESVDALIERIRALTRDITVLEERVEYLENFTRVSDIVSWTGRSNFPNFNGVARPGIPSPAGANGITGLGVSMISTGATYIFWGTGTIQVSSLSNNNVYYLLVSGAADDFANGISQVLSWHQGEPTISTLWIQGSGDAIHLPLYIDHTGIYIRTTYNINNILNAPFRFSKTMILMNPDSPLN